jgi:hypothetical protein
LLLSLATKSFVLRGLLAVLLLAACRRSTSSAPPLKGHFHVVVDSKPADMTSAFVVPRGDKVVRLFVANVDHDCAWALEGGVDRFRDGELRGSFDLAPVYTPDGGSSWQIVRGGFWGDPRAGWGNTTNGEARQWPAEVVRSAARCPTHIRAMGKQPPVHSRFDVHAAVEIDADLEPVCCPKDSEPPTGTMTVRIGSDVYPLRRAARLPNEIHITRISDPCDYENEDLVLYVSRDTASHAISVVGDVLPLRHPKVVNQNVTVMDEAVEKLTLQGSVDLETSAADSPPLHVEIDGEVPVAWCPTKTGY